MPYSGHGALIYTNSVSTAWVGERVWYDRREVFLLISLPLSLDACGLSALSVPLAVCGVRCVMVQEMFVIAFS
jgi:hypothetical protein